MLLACLLALTLGSTVTPVVRGQGSGCDSQLGLEDGRIQTEQLHASSVASDIQIGFARFNCCTDQATGAWCPDQNAAGDQWLEVRLYRPVNLTALFLQKPATDNTDDPVPTLNTFFVSVELATSPPGVLTTLSGDDGNPQEFTANYTANGEYRLDLPADLVVRRVRIQTANYTTRPCFRLELLGCSAPEGLVPAGIESPEVSLDYRSLDDMELVCMLRNDLAFGIQYQVTWYMNDVNVSTVMLTDQEQSARLNVTSSSFSQKQTHRCQIAACYSPDCEAGVLSDVKESNTYRPEILLLNTEDIQLEEGGPSAFVNFTTGGQTSDCTVNVLTFVADSPNLQCVSANPRTLPQLIFPDSSQSSLCYIQVTNENWRGTSSIPVTANQDGWLDGATESTITLTVRVGDQIFYQESDKTIKVTVSDQDTRAVCYSLNNPHVTTFDGKTYDADESGEYVLYRHKTLPYEVRAFYKKCVSDSSPRCNCGAAVRAGDDVVLFTGCTPGEAIRVHLFANGDIESGLVVRRYYGGNRYEVTLPTGARLVLREGYSGLIHLWFYPSPLDFNQTQGLCGSFDGDSSNDLERIDGGIAQDGQLSIFIDDWK
ncbi:hypothetical protein BaRGS_00036462 [Batillaria attramentaria]|uniref:VWFD domain-containing protein n=1 Tax=Batillaria attramentaria TaxID=370345 RepID=A0ABD0JBD4_9CAEN